LLKTFLSAGLPGVRRVIKTTTQTKQQITIAKTFSDTRGEKMSKKPRPFTNAEKLETQNGIKNKRKIGQKPNRTPGDPLVVLIYSATPMMPLSPSEVSHNREFASK
jgi:hypothetical protein